MYKSYEQVLGHPHDFEVSYRILSQEEGGRWAPISQGIRFNFKYAGNWPEHNDLWMIWPEFENESGSINFELHEYVPENGVARMWIARAAMRPIHQQRIKIDTKGYMMEGNRPIAECEVSRIVGLMDNPFEEITS